MSGFDPALLFVLAQEAGYVNDPTDPGGETNLGISKRQYPLVDIKTLTVEAVAPIYRRDYWLPIRGDDLPPAIALMVFDAAVNHGVRAAIICLQEAAYASPDGVIGPRTLAAVAGEKPKLVLIETAARRMKRYVELASFPIFGLGWSRRLMACLAASVALL